MESKLIDALYLKFNKPKQLFSCLFKVLAEEERRLQEELEKKLAEEEAERQRIAEEKRRAEEEKRREEEAKRLTEEMVSIANDSSPKINLNRPINAYLLFSFYSLKPCKELVKWKQMLILPRVNVSLILM